MSLQICIKHQCVHTGVCEACNWEASAKDKDDDVRHLLDALLEAETKINHLEALNDNPPIKR